MDAFDWLAEWYEAQCNGDWEHSFGVTIDTLDNPGWSLKIDLAGTDYEGRLMERQSHDYEHETDWWTCWVEDNVFHGRGGPRQLRSLAEAFRAWALVQARAL
ncbi:MAG TPA: immunity 53 family protein [Phenylobacterium sp.]